MTFLANRRGVLRTLFGTAAAFLPLPVMDFLLDDNGTAYAKGAPLPVRFGTWFWGLSLVPQRWTPAEAGAGFKLTADLEPLSEFNGRFSVLSGFNIPLDGASNNPHDTGVKAIRTGEAAPVNGGLPSVDVLISDKITSGNRFASIEIACVNDRAASYSGRSAGTPNPPEVDPLALYKRLFVDGFTDPNSGTFVPDVRVIAERSMLSTVSDQRKALMKEVGASDRARLDQYFTSLRQAETQLAVRLQKPPPAESCVVPQAPKAWDASTAIGDVTSNHEVMASLMALGLACNQTRVFNIALTPASSPLRMPDDMTGYHQLTHEEKVDPTAGYQVRCEKFVKPQMAAFAHLLKSLDAIKEGDGTLLDRSLILANSDVSDAKSHDINGIPIIVAGTAGGAVKSGLHVQGNGTPVSRVGLTMQHAMGLNAGSWGTKSMTTSAPIGEMLA